MSSENAKKVALDVIDAVSKGKLVDKEEITQKNGYTKSSARAQKAVRTKTYKETIRPFLQKLINERDRIIDTLSLKDLSDVQYEALIRSLDIATKNIQLLSGGETERQGITIQISEAIANKNGINPMAKPSSE